MALSSLKRGITSCFISPQSEELYRKGARVTRLHFIQKRIQKCSLGFIWSDSEHDRYLCVVFKELRLKSHSAQANLMFVQLGVLDIFNLKTRTRTEQGHETRGPRGIGTLGLSMPCTCQ